MPWTDGLSGSVLSIAGCTDSPLRVLAGPGTGKTYALMKRVQRLLEQGVDPRRILVCTFTRTAAADLRKSLSNVATPGADQVRAGTLHALSFSILSRNDVLVATGRTPRPLLQFEERFLLQDVSGAPFGGVRECGRRLRAFNAAWARLQSEEPGWPNDESDRQFGQRLVNWLRFHKAMLIGELIPETFRYLRDNPLAEARTWFDHVLVDEYQDLNKAEQVLLDVLAEAGSLVVIGDENQSIYSFKYAHPAGIAEFHQAHPTTHDEQLDVCRRCPKLVVRMANSLIANNPDRIPRTMSPKDDNTEGQVFLIQWLQIEDEAAGVARFVQKRVRDGSVAPGDVLILAPRRQFGYAVRDALNAAAIPAHSFFSEQALDGDPKDLTECQAQESLSLLTLLGNPGDCVALRCWCGFGSSSLNRNAWARLRSHCEQNGMEPFNVLSQLAEGTLRMPHVRPLIARFHLLTQRLATLSGLADQGLVDAIFPRDQEWATAIREQVSLEDGEELDAAALLEQVRTNVARPELPTDVDYVRVMSLHKSKGLTAKLVIVTGCVEGLIPTIDWEAPPDEQERVLHEQRRLFYVAITRTTDTLILSSVVGLPRDDAHRMRVRVGGSHPTIARTIATPFFRELGSSCPPVISGDQFLKSQAGEAPISRGMSVTR